MTYFLVLHKSPSKRAITMSHRIRVTMIVMVLLLSVLPLQAQVPVALSPLAKQQFFSQSGAPLASGCLFTYITGTSTPLATYTDGTGMAQNTNPIILDGGGFANVWLSNSSYRFVLASAGGVNCATGVTQYTVDNVSAYTVINQAQNLFLAGASSDPSGTAGELAYRNDLSCFRGFTSFWDCFVRLTDTQTLTNKTLTSPTITGTVVGAPAIPGALLNNPNINGIVVNGGPATYLSLSNDVTTGTTANTLTKMLGATLVVSAAGDAGGAIGITVAGAGKSGLATVQQNGAVSCVFDNSTTAGDYVQISTTVAGNCHDSGSSYPTTGQVIGRASTTAATGVNTLILFGPEVRPTSPTKIDLTAQAANISATPILTPSANGFYRFSCYTVVTQAATSSSTLPQCEVQYNDADSNVAETLAVTVVNTGNTVGATGGLNAPNGNFWFYAKSGVAISYLTVSYASTGGTVMQYAVHARLEGPF